MAMASKRGRPAGPQQGAREAVADIVAARKALGLSENELASRTGLSQSTVNRLLTRKSPRGRPPSRGYRIMQKIFLRSNRWLALTDAPANACWSKRSSICGRDDKWG